MPPTRRSSGLVQKPTVRQGIPKDVLVELNPRHKKLCMFCGRKEISEKLYGPLYQLNDIIVHYFCILLSSRAAQKGSDKEGIWGFLLKDIKSELTRGSRETCIYCKEVGATISCCSNNCKKIFHLPCGLENGSMHQYFQTFKSFCKNHRVIQTVDLAELQRNEETTCSICKESVYPYPSPSSLWAPCCKRNTWFHRTCIQQLALSSGYFFKCPLCNNVDLFKSRMLTLGIYVPSRKNSYLKKLNHRDASWETVPNAYAELLERPSTCDAENCVCPHHNKRNYQQDNGSWEIILCHTCGSNGTHMLCSGVKCGQNWFCKTCIKISESQAGGKRRRMESTGNICTNGISTADKELPPSPPPRNNSSRRIPRESRNIVTRESQRLNNNNNNNNNKETTIPTESQQIPTTSTPTPRLLTLPTPIEIPPPRQTIISRSTPQQLIDNSIVISDSDDDVQCVSYVDRPKVMLNSYFQNCRQMPIIQSYSSMNAYPPMQIGRLRAIRRLRNNFNNQNFNAATTSATIPTMETIDLTELDDDDDNNVDQS